MIPFIDLAAQQERIRPDLERRMAAVLAHGRYILGPEVHELEEALAGRVGVPHVITCANGTDALQISLMALGIGPGDEVITPSFNYVAAAEATALLGATPVYVEVNPATYLLEADAIGPALTARTKAVIPVSLFGQCSDMAAIKAVLSGRDITVIEDAAQSFGAKQNGWPSCGLTKIATTSFFPAKPLGCYGDGGAIFTDDPHLARELRRIARHGQDKKYHNLRIGMNSRLDTLQAAVLLAKLEVYDEELELREAAAARYTEMLAATGVEVPVVAEGNTSAWAQYTIQTERRDAVAAALRAVGIPTAVYYPIPLHRQPAVAADVALPISDLLCERVLSLPFHPWICPTVQARVASAIHAAA